MIPHTHVHQVVVALIRRDDELLLVQQHEPYEPGPTWVLPGGSVESNEFLHESLVREAREETGITILHPGHLAYIAQYDYPDEQHQLIVYVFEVQAWAGNIACDDPDGHVMQACFFPLDAALDKLEDDHFRHRCEPALSYLRGECQVGSLWSYRHDSDGNDTLLRGPDSSKVL